MFIENIADYLQKLKKRDIKPEIFTVFEFPDDLTILEILNSIGYRLANLFGFVKINTTTKTVDTGEASVNVTGDVDNLNFDFTIPQGERGPAGAPGPENLVIVTATASTTVQGEYIPDTTYTKALADIQANKAVMIKLENVPGRYYIPYSSSNAEILASAGTVSGSKQSIELYLLKWTASNNTITITGTKEGCIADGGTAGQVLVKKSNESFDTEWKLHYKIVIYGQPFNKSDLIKLFNNGTLIYVYNATTYRLYTIYALAENILYGISGITFNATVHSISSNRCQITDDNNITLLYDTIYGIANGGTTGQILAKKSNTNGDTKWIDAPGGGGGLTKTVLWHNNSPRAAFESQTITTTENGFDYPLLIIEFAESSTGFTKLSAVATDTTLIGTNATMLSYYKGYRTIRTSSGTTWTVSAGFNISTNTSDNDVVIPLNIIGYK